MNGSTMRLELVAQWEALHEKLSADERFSGKLSGLFVGHLPSSFSEQKQRILYVGKATAGDFALKDASHKRFGHNLGAFWAFARRLSRSIDNSCDDLRNLAWSNLCKIGVIGGNPNEVLAKEMEILALKALREEVNQLEPTIIVFVTEGYLDDYVYAVLGTGKPNDGFVSKNAGGWPLYYRKSRDGFPPILWIKHPQGKRREYTNAALEIAIDLLSPTR